MEQIFRQNRILLVEQNRILGRVLEQQLSALNYKVVWSTSVQRAIQLLQDASFVNAGLDTAFDALLSEFDLPDSTALRLVADFQRELPDVPVALMVDAGNVATVVWAQRRKIQIMHRPVFSGDLARWVDRVQAQAVA